MRAGNSRRLNRHRTVENDRKRFDHLVRKHARQVIHNLLRPTDRERRHQNPRFLRHRLDHQLSELADRVRHRPVIAIAVSRFHEHHVCARETLGVFQNGRVARPQVAGEHEHFSHARFIQRQLDARRAEDVSRLVHPHRDPRRDRDRFVIRQRFEERNHARDIGRCVERRQRRFVLLRALAIFAFGVLLLNSRRVLQNQLRHFERSGRGVNRPRKSTPHQQRQPPRVIQMRVCEHHGREVLRIEIGRHLIGAGREIAALEHAKIDKHRRAPRLHEIRRAGDFARRAEECDGVHAECLVRRRFIRVCRSKKFLVPPFLPERRATDHQQKKPQIPRHHPPALFAS